MSQRPERDLNWVPDDSTGITVPSQTKQNAGWLVEKPARQFFNWMWNRLSRWVHYLSGQSQEFIVIDSTNANEKDYDTLAAYIADTPAAGDKVLVKETQALTAQMIIPSFITLRILDGVYFTRSTNEANSVIKFGADIIIEGILNLVLSHTGTTAKAVEFDGDNVVGRVNVENSSTGTLTDAYVINSGKTGNVIDGFLDNTGGGTITNEIDDNAGEITNIFNLIDSPNSRIVRALGNALPGLPILSSPELKGSGFSISGANLPALTALNDTDIAFIDFVIDELRAYRFNGSTWSLVGSGFSITLAGGQSALAALDGTDVAFINGSQDELRTYRFNGSTWSLVGSGFSLSGGTPALAALNDTDIAFIDDVNDELRAYRFNGSTWSLLGSGLPISTVGAPSLTALNGTDIAFIDSTNEELRTYRFNGSIWSLVGTGLSVSGIGSPAIAALNSIDIALIGDGNDELTTYRFDGVSWVLLGIRLSLSNTSPALAALNGTDVAFIDGSNDSLRAYRFRCSPGLPYNPVRSL